ncbi:hypothetical protein [Paraburkholderia azotifigens]|uniref:Uncharacterized protein n=1 Tax=Paraburkholderia azotifigens TaxID=2057004 RepID=A0A5C6VNR4_9BURK|nr:hypothetical protein [Paraburkholderia azotifigens]TXC86196.1 hypothetical protein FRZ40_00605 [Paraburkholderia azotifigens]
MRLFKALVTCVEKCVAVWSAGPDGGPQAKNEYWRCERLSFAYFSLPRQRKVGAAPHRGNACSTDTKPRMPAKKTSQTSGYEFADASEKNVTDKPI